MREARLVVSVRGLGYVAVLLSIVSPDRLTALLRAGLPDTGRVPIVLAEWIVAVGYLVGGVALVTGRHWGRWMLAVASAIGVVGALFVLVVPEAEIPRYGPPPSVWIFLYGTIGAAAMWARGPRAMLGQWQSLANVSYAFLGLVAMWVSYVLYVYFPGADASADAVGLGFFVAIPFGTAGAIALVVACSQSLVGWRHVRLVVLLGITIGFGIYVSRGWSYEWVPWSIYGVVSTAIAMTPRAVVRRGR